MVLILLRVENRGTRKKPLEAQERTNKSTHMNWSLIRVLTPSDLV